MKTIPMPAPRQFHSHCSTSFQSSVDNITILVYCIEEFGLKDGYRAMGRGKQSMTVFPGSGKISGKIKMEWRPWSIRRRALFTGEVIQELAAKQCGGGERVPPCDDVEGPRRPRRNGGGA
jgi:hypothetical protein